MISDIEAESFYIASSDSYIKGTVTISTTLYRLNLYVFKDTQLTFSENDCVFLLFYIDMLSLFLKKKKITQMYFALVNFHRKQ